MVAKMLTKTVFLLLALAIIQVPCEYIEPQFFDDLIEEEFRADSPRPRIVSGWDATLGQHPHQAHMRTINTAGNANICGGSFVHRDWMVTSAFCTNARVSLLIRGGMISLSATPEYLSETSEYYIYPTFDKSRPNAAQPNDISIVRLQEPIVYTRNLKPICMQPSADANRNYEEVRLHASGFGRTWTDSSASLTLKWVYLRGVSNPVCRHTFRPALITDATICARWFNVTSQSICGGDIGGPLVYTNPEGERLLVGVASFMASANFGGCHTGLPAAFIRPGHFHKWFTEVTGLDLDEKDETTTTTAPTTAPPTTAPPTTVPPTTAPPTTVPPTTEPPTTVPSTTVPPNTVPPTTVPSTTVPPTTEPLTSPPITPEGEVDEGSVEDEDDTSEEDEDLPELLKRLQVKVKVKVNVNQFRKKHKKNKKIR